MRFCSGRMQDLLKRSISFFTLKFKKKTANASFSICKYLQEMLPALDRHKKYLNDFLLECLGF